MATNTAAWTTKARTLGSLKIDSLRELAVRHKGGLLLANGGANHPDRATRLRRFDSPPPGDQRTGIPYWIPPFDQSAFRPRAI